MITKPRFLKFITEIEAAGLLAYDYFTNNETENRQKTDGTVVTAIDQAIEERLVLYIRNNFPDDTIVNEEGKDYVGTSDFVWHIDPIDGTDNFLRRIPFCAISVARLGSTDEDSFAVVHNPITKQTFSSFMDEGVYEREHLHCLNDFVLAGKVVMGIAIGAYTPDHKETKYNVMKGIAMKFGTAKSHGCCALELAYVAANRLDGTLVAGINSYDYAAGLFLVKSAGGMISVFRNGNWQAWNSTIKDLCAKHGETIFVSHAGVHADALELIGDPYAWSDS